MASALHGYRESPTSSSARCGQALEEQPERENAWVRFAEVLEDGLKATVVDAIRLADRIVEVIVRAPFAARRFRPGQFYRFRTTRGPARCGRIRLTMETLALTGPGPIPSGG